MPSLILCYHKVGPESAEGRFLNVSPETLAKHVKFFLRRGFQGRTVSGLALAPNVREIAFTFDDAYQCATDHVPEIFKPQGLSATFYAVPGLEESSWDGTRARKLASMEKLLELERGGHEIGNHTYRHPHLAGLTRRIVLEELLLAQQALVDEGLTITSVCYPFGSHNDLTVRVAKRIGLDRGVTLSKGLVPEGADPLRLPRVVVGFRDGPPLLTYKIWVRPLLQRVGL